MATTRSERVLRSERRAQLTRTGLVRLSSFKAKTQANPRELAVLLEPEDVAAHRNLACKHYDACLDHVVMADWPSFSCSRCVWRHEGQLERAEESPRRESLS